MGDDPILAGLKQHSHWLRRLAHSRQCRIQWINHRGQEFYNMWRPIQKVMDLEKAAAMLREDGTRAWVAFR